MARRTGRSDELSDRRTAERAVKRVEQLQKEVEALQQELAFTRSHLVAHHGRNGATCKWEREVLALLSESKGESDGQNSEQGADAVGGEAEEEG